MITFGILVKLDDKVAIVGFLCKFLQSRCMMAAIRLYYDGAYKVLVCLYFIKYYLGLI